jgi:MoxR-like ATPase
MQERQVTVDGATRLLPRPFFVLATQNPVELEGTFPLPEAQLDRFLLRVQMGYPEQHEEERILSTNPAERDVSAEPIPGVDPRSLTSAAADVSLGRAVRHYVVALARATRVHPDARVGASPRAVEQLGDAARAKALLEGRSYVLPDDVKTLAPAVLGHRLVLSTDARIRDRRPEDVLVDVLAQVPVPVEFDEEG